MSKILGANWKTSVSGIGAAIFTMLGAIAALPYSFGEIASLMPPQWKGRVAVAGFAAGFILKVWNAIQQKDKSVTGGVIQQTADGSIADPEKLKGVSQSVADTQKAEA